jgi:D-alanyl-D-alanine carboxypeptidase/D-alanyl-D-alanine-endopeptidase (penicillin-binding protein 4)
MPIATPLSSGPQAGCRFLLALVALASLGPTTLAPALSLSPAPLAAQTPVRPKAPDGAPGTAGSPGATLAVPTDEATDAAGGGGEPRAGSALGSGDAYVASPTELLTFEIDHVLRESVGPRASVGALVVSLARGDTLYALNAGRLLEPASNVKLFTTAAALHFLGARYIFRTILYGTGPVEAGVLRGDLVLEGRGDPNLSGRFYADSMPYAFDRLAEGLRQKGVTRVAGDLVADDSYFEGPALGEGWAWDTQQWWYSAESDALSFNDNTITLIAEPGSRPGEPARIVKVPDTDYVTVQNEVETVRGRSGSAIAVRRDPGSNDVTVTGRVAARSGGASTIVSVHDPALFAASVFRNRLERAGIEVEGDVRRLEADEDAEAKTKWTVFAMHLSPPLSEVVKVVNKRSQNFYAEQLLKTIGAEVRGRGSAEAGIAAVDQFLRSQAGLEPGSIYMVDGSGLSRLNLVTPAAIVKLLSYMRTHPSAKEFYESLLVPGENTQAARLDEPLTRGNVHAKTGTVRYVSAYSGYVTSADGELLAFAILLNNRPDGKASSVRLENEVVRTLARFAR